MLSDLVQYFTNNKFSDIDDYDLVAFLRYIHQYTHDEDVLSSIETSVNDGPDRFADIFEYGFNEELYMNDIHLCDALELAYDNAFMTMLLSIITNTFSFHVYYEDIDIRMMTDNGDCHYSISDFEPYNANRKIDHFINGFILSNLNDYDNGDGTIDDYSADAEHFIISYIYFKNKSVGRKIRKAYTRDDRVRSMFHELNYFMVNGEFVFLCQYNLETIGYNGFFDMDTVYFGIESLRKDWFKDKHKNIEGISFKRGLMNMNNYFVEYTNAEVHTSFFNSLLKIHSCSDREVIL